MTKTEALAHAAAARHAATVAQARAALYTVTFGGSSQLAQDALMAVDVALEVAGKWERFAGLHHATRARMLRTQALPAFMFGYRTQP